MLIDLQDVASLTKREDLSRLLPHGSIGVELGVAEGTFSRRLLETGRFATLFSVDRWAGDRGHDSYEYQTAVQALAPFGDRSSIVRKSFDQALPLFDDEYFDFIYIDGYAHTGEEGGQTFRDWWPKLKPGGVFAGDDYDPEWPLVIEQVDAFMAEHALPLAVLKPAIAADPWSRYPSWATRKPCRGA